MRSASIVFVLSVVLASPTLAAQKSKDTSKPPTEVTGCVSDRPTNGTFTFTDVQSGGKFRLTGKQMQKYAGKMVAIISGQDKRLSISGGLWPSPNIAAQAGAIDPAQASIARQPGGGAVAGTGALDLPELRVVRVRNVAGSCQ
jgi:hypothetical protein